MPITQLVSEAIKIDVSQKALANKDYLISIEDITAWEATYGKIPDQAIVLLQTGFGQYWPDRLKYMGTDKRGVEGVAELHFPGLDPKAADWLVKNRKLSAIGLDTASGSSPLNRGRDKKHKIEDNLRKLLAVSY